MQLIRTCIGLNVTIRVHCTRISYADLECFYIALKLKCVLLGQAVTSRWYHITIIVSYDLHVIYAKVSSEISCQLSDLLYRCKATKMAAISGCVEYLTQGLHYSCMGINWAKRVWYQLQLSFIAFPKTLISWRNYLVSLYIKALQGWFKHNWPSYWKQLVMPNIVCAHCLRWLVTVLISIL